jgi:hypothetical protein
MIENQVGLPDGQPVARFQVEVAGTGGGGLQGQDLESRPSGVPDQRFQHGRGDHEHGTALARGKNGRAGQEIQDQEGKTKTGGKPPGWTGMTSIHETHLLAVIAGANRFLPHSYLLQHRIARKKKARVFGIVSMKRPKCPSGTAGETRMTG